MDRDREWECVGGCKVGVGEQGSVVVCRLGREGLRDREGGREGKGAGLRELWGREKRGRESYGIGKRDGRGRWPKAGSELSSDTK
jgi:hypothetical protein